MAQPTPAYHASAVAMGGSGVIITGPSGSGKSDLVLRLIDRGAKLISDDYIHLKADPAGPIITAPANIAGKLEIRGLGIVNMPFQDGVTARLLVRMASDAERFPGPLPLIEFAGFALPTLAIDPFHQSSPIKIEWAIKTLVDHDRPRVALTTDDTDFHP
ncbi:MAG: aldolase [Sphingomonadales bacterium]|nr:aldolase [Sphingomonadales bacterium]